MRKKRKKLEEGTEGQEEEEFFRSPLYGNISMHGQQNNNVITEFSSICQLLALFVAHHILHFSRLKVKSSCKRFDGLFRLHFQ